MTMPRRAPSVAPLDAPLNLRRSLLTLVEAAPEVSGLAVFARFLGGTADLTAAAHDALLGLAVDWIIEADLEMRASAVSILLVAGRRGVTMVVRDDGVGLGHRPVFERGGGGLRGLQRGIEDAGGTLRLRNAHPRGVVAIARFGPQERK